MSTKKTGEGRDNRRDPIDALKASAQATRAAVEKSLKNQDESLLRAEAYGQAAVRDAELGNVSERADPTKDEYFEIDKRVGGTEIALAEALAEASQARHRHHRAAVRPGKGSHRPAG